MIKIIQLILVITIVGICNAEYNANNSLDSKLNYNTPVSCKWLTLGLGGEGLEDSDNILLLGSLINLSMQYNHSIFTFQYISSLELFPYSYPARTVKEISLLYGITANNKNKIVRVAFSTGLSGVYGQKPGDYIPTPPPVEFPRYKTVKYNSLGIPFNFQAFILPSSHVGIGIIYFANLNNEKTYHGIMLCIQLGKLKESKS